jgi:hypothetical protein
MARRESAQSVQQDCFLPEWRSPFVRVKAKQRPCAVPAAVTHLAQQHWQANSPAKRPAPVAVNSQVKTAD